VNNELERTWKEAVAVQFDVLPKNSLGANKEYHKNPPQENCCPN
jgi:hypothetical protein